jgi:hypothetical protein
MRSVQTATLDRRSVSQIELPTYMREQMRRASAEGSVLSVTRRGGAGAKAAMMASTQATARSKSVAANLVRMNGASSIL